MPVYEYQCKACGREFEYQQRMSDPDKTTCEACGGSLDRLISRTAFQLKGSGWYKDLYSSQKPAGKPESGAEASGSTDKAASGDKAAATPASGSSEGASSGSGSSSSGGSGGGSSSSGASGGGSSGTITSKAS